MQNAASFGMDVCGTASVIRMSAAGPRPWLVIASV